MSTHLLALLLAASRANPDLAFVRSQEEWVYEARLGSPIATHDWFTRDERAAVLGLGSPRWADRRNAERLVGQMPPDRLVAVACWYRHHRDPAIAEACRALLGRAFRCLHCDGDGYCPNRPTIRDDWGMGWTDPCDACGRGHFDRYANCLRGPRSCELCGGSGDSRDAWPGGP